MSRITVSILGTEYKIIRKDYLDEPEFERKSLCGYCSYCDKTICVCNFSTMPGWQHETEENCKSAENETLRHEVIHAFLNESGLQDSTNIVDCGWSKNEEMIDWLAIQFPKIAKVFEELKIL